MIVATRRKRGARWAQSWRRYRNYVFIVITLVLVAMQVYLYMSTPAEVLDTKDDSRFKTAVSLSSVTNENPGRRLAAKDGNASKGNSFGAPKFGSRHPGRNKLYDGRQVKNDLLQQSIPADGFIYKTENMVTQNVSGESSVCGHLDPYAQGALSRAHSKQCKNEIVQVACRYKKKELYPQKLPRFCPLGGTEYGQYVGCFGNDKNEKFVADLMTDFQDSNTPISCVNHCLRSGFEYAGLQSGFECWCSVSLATKLLPLSNDQCNVSCSGNKNDVCGGQQRSSVYRTGFGIKPSDVASYVDPSDHEIQNTTKARILFMLTVNGRAVRQVHRLLKVIYRPQHYYYIHVDARQDYLHRELSKTTALLPNVRMSASRFATIWGGASLLTMLLKCMEDALAIDEWRWDYFLNLSESDYPVKTVEELEAFLTKYPGKNFIKSHGKDTPRFIRKQGLNMLFHECDNHMWRLGSRDMQDGIRIDGGSDWVCLNRDFIQYLTYGNDELLVGFKSFWKYSLLPAESFFHTVLQNSMYCTTVINNNLHLTNWLRKQGCKCQYKHIVDWCGCSPNDFMPEDLSKIQSLVGKPIYLSRKFEAIINQKIIDYVDTLIGVEYSIGTDALNSFWMNEYHYLDKNPVDDISYSFYQSFARLTLAQLQHGSSICDFSSGRILESTVYKYNDTFQGLIMTFEIRSRKSNEMVTFEAFLEPILLYQSFMSIDPISRLKSVKVGTNYDPKEEVFRNFGNLLGPQSDLVVEFRWSPGKVMVVTSAFIDPAGTLAMSHDISITQGSLVHNYQPEMKKPLRPGLWTLKVLHAWQRLAELQFLILPYSHIDTEPIDANAAQLLHSGPEGLYGSRDFSDIKKYLMLGDSDKQKLEADRNAKKFGPELLAWMDELVQKAWHIKDTCLVLKGGSVHPSSSCLPLSVCSKTKWSTKFPDPKSDLSNLNLKTGVLR